MFLRTRRLHRRDQNIDGALENLLSLARMHWLIHGLIEKLN
jgi:agmatine/peptidylarginine deiminase